MHRCITIALLLFASSCGSDDNRAAESIGVGTAVTDPIQAAPHICTVITTDNAAMLIEALTDGDGAIGGTAIVTDDTGRTFQTALSECRYEVNGVELVVAYYDTPCDFSGASTEPTVQVSSDPRVFLAGFDYGCGDLGEGSAVAIAAGNYPEHTVAEVQEAWIEFFDV